MTEPDIKTALRALTERIRTTPWKPAETLFASLDPDTGMVTVVDESGGLRVVLPLVTFWALVGDGEESPA